MASTRSFAKAAKETSTASGARQSAWDRPPASPSSAAGPPHSKKRPVKKQPSGGQSPASKGAALVDTKQSNMHDRVLLLFANLIGLTVQVTVQGNVVYEGIFHGAQTETQKESQVSGLSLVLKKARKIYPAPAAFKKSDVAEKLTVASADFVLLEAAGVDLDFATKNTTKGPEGFQTDTAISGHDGHVMERQLQKWTADDTMSGDLDKLQLADHNGNWDQFAANEKLFGLTTDFKEELYTTKLDKNSDDYRRKEREAERLAREIEQSSTNNIHVAEERGALMDDRQLNEEDKYGAVVRKPGSYVPPSLRQKETPVATSAKDMKHATTDGKKIGALESQTINAPIGSLTPKGAEGKVEIEKKAPIGDKNRLSLNPNAPSFSFNIGASEFQPTFGAPSITPQASISIPVHMPPASDRLRGLLLNELRTGAKSIRNALCKAHFKLPKKRQRHEQDVHWPYGNKPYQAQFVTSSNTSESAGSSVTMPVPQAYGMGYAYGYPSYSMPMPAPYPHFPPPYGAQFMSPMGFPAQPFMPAGSMMMPGYGFPMQQGPAPIMYNVPIQHNQMPTMIPRPPPSEDEQRQ